MMRAVLPGLVLGAVVAAGAPAFADCDTYPPSQTGCSPSPSPSASPSESPKPIGPKGTPSPKPSKSPKATDSPKPGKSPKPTKSPKTTTKSTQSGLTLDHSQVPAGQDLRVSSSGWKPGSSVRIELHSTPVILGTALADSRGAFSVTVTIPTETQPGRHTVVAYGVAPNGAARSLSAGLEVRPGAATPRGGGPGVVALPRTGAAITAFTVLGLALLGFGAFVTRSGRRRRRVA
jgi:LPXTG-motif cell wall-anchored protein